MATLNINGRKVTVDDSFLSLTPEQQNATVDEIAASLGGQKPAALTGKIAPRGSGGVMSPNVEDRTPPPAEPSLLDKFLTSSAATANGLAASVPFLQNTTDAIGGTVAQLTGGNYNDFVNHQRDVRDQLAQKAPLARTAGEVGGLFAGTGAIGATKLGAEALGLTGGLGKQIVNSALSSTGLSTLDALSNGETGKEALASGGLGGLIGGIVPVVGAGIRTAGRAAKKSIVDPIATLLSEDNAVTGNLAKVIGADKTTGNVLSAADEAVGQKAGVPILNIDRYGPATRRLARTASNIDDESKAMFSRTVDDRFAGQTTRAENFVKQLMGGAVDDLALKDALRAAADKTNSLGYAKAFNDPKARAVWSQPISELMQSPTFRSAVDAAEGTAADRAAVSGFKAVKNPFVQAADGSFTLKTNADGTRALPSLQFWDQVKRNLDTLIEKARPTATEKGDRALYGTLTGMKRKLVGALDSQVPSYAATRSKAAEFFGADDAIDVGRKAFQSTKTLPEQTRGHALLNATEKDAASVGYASELIDNIRASGDNRNLAIANFFNNPAARARNELYLGTARARQLEAYVRVEQAVDMLRGAVKGNSSTAEQLIAAGAVGTGVGLGTGDWKFGFTVGALSGLGMKALKAAGKNVDERVMKKVAEALLSNDPKALERAIHNASLSKAHMDALEGIMQGLSLAGRSAALTAVASN